MALAEAFGVNMAVEDAAQLTTPRKVTDYIADLLSGRGMTREAVATAVRKIIEKETAIHDFSDDDDFVRDMNLD
jgi:hypothetical protein